MQTIRHFREIRVWQAAMDSAMRIFQLTKGFPKDELYSLTNQIRRSSRSVAANISEAWRRRRYPAAFVSKLYDCETEAAETQTSVELALRCGYLPAREAELLDSKYEHICSQLVLMIERREDWLIRDSARRSRAKRSPDA